MQSGRACPLHLPSDPGRADPGRSRTRSCGQWLRTYSTAHPCHGFRRAWAALRHDEHRGVNKKKVHRLWKEEGLQRRAHSPRKRAGCHRPPEVLADAPKVVWALDFQFDSTIDGKAIKIASMLDEHTRESLLNIVKRSITAERLIAELRTCFDRGRRASAGAAHGQRAGAYFPSAAIVLRWARSDSATSRRERPGITATSNRSTTGYEGSASTATTGRIDRGPRGHRRLQGRA